jgi:transcriptional regulator with XRE-family HTH domain
VTFGEALNAELRAHGLTQKEAAQKARLSQAGINQYCSGAKLPAYRQYRKLLRAFPRLFSHLVEEVFEVE